MYFFIKYKNHHKRYTVCYNNVSTFSENNMKATQLRLKDHSASPAKIAHFLKKCIPITHHIHNGGQSVPPLQYYLDLANELIAGGTYQHEWKLDIPENDLLYEFIIETYNADQIAFMKRQADYAHCTQLMEKGAAGDAQAAIDFCKAFKEGRYVNAPFA